MPSVLTTKEATVRTVSVEIHALKVGKKQVTMGMFRQLPYRPLVDWDAFDPLWCDDEDTPPVLRGTPWGHVNYWWTDDAKADDAYIEPDSRWSAHQQWLWLGERRHLLWASQELLARCVVCERVPQWVIEQYGNETVIRPAWHRIWEELCALPQLFIAV